MDQRYYDYCKTDRRFYDTPTRAPDRPGFAISTRPLPPGWRARTIESWRVYQHDGAALPAQGWKIHASARLDNADKVLDVIWDFCVRGELAFKHLSAPHELLASNSKYADRGSSGKLATLYPLDDEHFERVLRELGPQLEGQAGPYILSDLRWGGGPLHVRYGGFARRYGTFGRGRPEPAIEDPTGALVPDRREAGFSVPPWVRLPECLAPHLAARNAVTVADLPYRIDRALHFSNGGGVYAGTHRETGERVVLKEARPHAGLDSAHADAVTRLNREHAILRRLAGLDCVPAPIGGFTLGEHEFLVQAFLDGTPLHKEVGRRYPLNGRCDDPTALREYVDWAVAVVADVERNAAALHERGVIHGDLHAMNILVRPDGRTAIIDFETASLVDEGRRPALGHPAFAAPADRSGFDIDRYALACLRLSMFLPITSLLAVDRAKAAQLATEISEVFPIPPGYLDGAVETITGQLLGREPRRHPAEQLATFHWPRIRRSIAGAILASATPDRDDRLFPGDIEQFSSGGLNFAYGAAGVLYGLAVAGAGRHPEHERWLIERVRRVNAGARLGFYDGLHGVAYVLDHLDHRDEALSLLERCQQRPWRQLGLDLAGGLAGIALNLHHFAAGDPGWCEVAALVAARLGSLEGSARPAGLMYGSSGPALLFIRLFEHTGDGGYLDLAATALDQDLRRCVVQTDGSLQVNEGWRTSPYLGAGSIGIGLVLREFLAHRPDERYTEALEQVMLAAQSEFYAHAGLLRGRAGALLLHAGNRSAAVERQVRRLAWHAMDHEGRLAFPGDELLRLSMDLATGSAGVLLALAAVAGEPDATLPFLPRPNRLEGGDRDGTARPATTGGSRR